MSEVAREKARKDYEAGIRATGTDVPNAFVAGVDAGWDARAAQVVPQPNREALIGSLKVAMLGTTDGDFLDPDDPIPAGEMFRLAGEWFESLAPAPLTIDREAETELQECIEQEIELGGDAGSITAAVREFLARMSAQPVAGEVECNCGWGGMHDPDNPRCAANGSVVQS